MSAPSREAGFTLIELLVTIVILSIIVAGLGQALFVGLKTTTATATTLVDAGDEQALASRLLADVKAADTLGTTGGPACAPAAPAPPAPAPARVLWTQARDPATGATTVAAYVVKRIPADPVAGKAARSELRRVMCVGGAPPPPGAGEGIVLARWPGVGDVPSITCDGRPRSGGQTTLREPLAADGTSVSLTSASGFPTSSPRYEIAVDGERMAVTGGFGTDAPTVERGPSATGHAAGATVTWGPVVLRDALAASATTVSLSDATGLPASGPPYAILVDGETMTVTGGFGTTALTVSRAAGVEHAAGHAVTTASCGAGGRFRGTPVATTLAEALGDAADTSVVIADATGFPAAGPPYAIVVDGETMTVTGGFGTTTLTVARDAGAPAHAAGKTVTWGQTVVLGDLSASATTLALSDVTGFPASGPDYRIVVDGEPMTVTGGFGTPSLTVARASGVAHLAQAAVSWTPSLVTVEVPRGDASGVPGAPPFLLSIARRAT